VTRRAYRYSDRSALSVAAAVNDRSTLKRNLAASPMIAGGGVALITETEHANASGALNAGLERAESDVVVCAHQDVYFPDGWEERLLRAVIRLDSQRVDWAVLGVAGIDLEDRFAGHVFSGGLRKECGGTFDGPVEVGSLDEVVLIVRKSSGVRFDDALPGYHLYGTDIVRTAMKAGRRCYAIDAPVVHNSRAVPQLGKAYGDAYRYMQAKWRDDLPVRTCTIPIVHGAGRLWRRRLRAAPTMPIEWLKAKGERPDPMMLARAAGYQRAA
jgi:glycosyltransferase involved in cell wall biosynthesis